MPSIVHYLIVRQEKRLIVHHTRAADGSVRTVFVTGPALSLDPPGLTLDLSAVGQACG